MSKLVGIPANAAFQGHDWYSMLTGNVGEIALNACGDLKGMWGVLCELGCEGAPFHYLHGDLWGVGLEPSTQGGTGDLLAMVILVAGLFNGFVFLTFTRLMAIITLQLFLPCLLD